MDQGLTTHGTDQFDTDSTETGTLSRALEALEAMRQAHTRALERLEEDAELRARLTQTVQRLTEAADRAQTDFAERLAAREAELAALKVQVGRTSVRTACEATQIRLDRSLADALTRITAERDTLRAAYEKARGETAACTAEIKQVRATMDGFAKSARTIRERAERNLARERERTEAAERQLDALLSSRSWRALAPIRNMVGRLRAKPPS